jgi:hypothetical protein
VVHFDVKTRPGADPPLSELLSAGGLYMPKIKVHEKALAHLSRGLYRSPASALRELVSNAWDASATWVRVNTSYPNFFQLSVSDNGDGFTRPDFEHLMRGGIGNSPKRPLQHLSTNQRPLIGRLGIGMLGIAQICGSFTVTSRPRRGTGFRSRVNLYDLLKERLDNDDSTIISEQVISENESLVEVDVGEYTFEDFDVTSIPQGTTILADNLHPTFIRSFQQSLTFDKYIPPPLDWKDALKIVSKVHSLQELGDYWRLLWELSAACPIPYLDARAVPQGAVAEDDLRLRNVDFKVIVDGRTLLKPVYLKGNSGGYTVIRIPRREQKLYGRPLVFHGYVAVQEGSQLRPDELRGIMLRIKDVGIGYYDPSLLDYRFNEGPRSRWVTGEIFVSEGLEDALNIDRDSFNKFHPQFRAIQEFVHEVLRKEVFPEVYKKIDVRSGERAQSRETARVHALEQSIAGTLDIAVKVTQQKPSEGEDRPVVEITETAKRLEVSVPAPSEVQTKKPNRQLASAILVLYEIAGREKNAEKRRGLFTQLLLELLSKW